MRILEWLLLAAVAYVVYVNFFKKQNQDTTGQYDSLLSTLNQALHPSVTQPQLTGAYQAGFEAAQIAGAQASDISTLPTFANRQPQYSRGRFFA